MDLERFKGKKIALLGFAVENISVAKFLLKNNLNFEIRDQAPVEKLLGEAQKEIKDKGLKIKTGADYLSNLDKFDLIIRSPGVKYLTPKVQAAKKRGAEITNSTKLFFDWCPAKIIGITGTKGKGTTASIIYKIMKRKSQIPNPKSQTNQKFKIPNSKSNGTIEQSNNVFLVGNIGKASFDIVEKVKPNDLVVFELSSFQIQDLEISPNVAVVVNLTDDHLDYHQTLEEYRATKQSVVKYQSKDDFAILNKDYPECYKLKEFGKAKKYFFSSKEKTNGAYVNKNGDVILTINGEEKICSQDETVLIGRHNLENIAAAAIVGKIFNVSVADIRQAVVNFEGLPHCLEFVREVDGVKFYNDSFSTNPMPTIAAVKSFSKPITIILGGSEKGADFRGLAEEIKKSSIKNIILIGKEGLKIRKALENIGIDAKIIDGGPTIKKIVKRAKELSAFGSVVLFSPACASFDMFKNYKDRGEKFREAVEKL